MRLGHFLVFILGIAAVFIALPLAVIALFLRSMGSELNTFSQVFYIPALVIFGAFGLELIWLAAVGDEHNPRSNCTSARALGTGTV